jgi:NAD(P)-dependent dehydrogenase (short-subunit alcohol dehydrogenase family)
MGQFSTRPPHSALPPRPAKNFALHAGKGFLVTGAAGGVGCAAAALLAARGARVALADVRAEALKAAVATTASPEAFAVVLDAADPASIAATVRSAEARLGRIDGLVNCAAIVIHANPLEAAWADWERIFRVNLFGAYEASRLVAKSMIAAGVRGAIVNVASEAGKKGHIDSLAYSASKAALINMTRTLSTALARHDINVNCVCPGGVATDMLREVAIAYGQLVDATPAEVFAQLVSSQLRRHIEPDEGAHDLFPFERRRRYNSRAGGQRGWGRHAVLATTPSPALAGEGWGEGITTALIRRFAPPSPAGGRRAEPTEGESAYENRSNPGRGVRRGSDFRRELRGRRQAFVRLCFS